MSLTNPPVSESWKYCPRCGSESRKAGKNPFECSDANCSYTHYFSPCSAVGGLIVGRGQQVLFIVRGKEPGRGKLGLPGGFIDAGETAEAALIREVHEEVGLKVVSTEFLASFPNQYVFGGVVWPVTDLFFVAAVESLDKIRTQEGEVEGWRFLKTDEVRPDDLAFDTHRKALNVYCQRCFAADR